MRRAWILALAWLPAAAGGQATVTDFLGVRSATGYAMAEAPRRLEFPADHGAHPEYRSEWWYFTGNLAADGGRHFGFQLTFFRFALSPQPIERESAWAANQAWMAHFTLTDTANGRFHAAERLGRGALGIAGANALPFRVWLDNWQAVSLAPNGGLFPLHLEAQHGPVAIELELTAVKPLVLQGQEGWDRKGTEPGNASYYYSFMRLAAQGRLSIGDQRFEVGGAAWMDREWSSNALSADLVGWDWFSLQLSDGSEFMYYRLRRQDGTAGPFSSGAIVLPKGDRIDLAGDEVRLQVRRHWQSPRGNHRYPVAWSVEIPSRGLALEIEPQVDDQELDLTVRYWDGAIRARGISGNEPVSGQGYLELVGY